MPSGHVRWLLEQYEFDFDVVFPLALDAGNLKAKYDVHRCSPTAASPKRRRRRRRWIRRRQPGANEIPAEFRNQLGRVSIKSTLPQLKKFAEEGGVIVAFGGSAVLGDKLGLPVSDHLVEVAQDGSEKPLPGTKFYIPGSILQVAVDNTNPLAFGFEKKVDVFFDSSPVMELAPNATLMGVKPVAWFDSKNSLRFRLGVGPALSRRRHRGRRSETRQGQGVPVRARDHLPRAAARNVQVPVQQHSVRHRAGQRRARARRTVQGR